MDVERLRRYGAHRLPPSATSRRRRLRVRLPHGWKLAFLASATAVALAAGALAYAAAYAPWFAVNHLRITGTDGLDPAEVQRAAQVLGSRMVTVDPAEVARRVEEVPLVRTASVRLRWPDTVSIVVQQRAPWGTWVAQGTSYAVDQEGVILGYGSGPPGSPTIQQTDLPRTPVAPGARIDANAVRAAERLIKELPGAVSQSVVALRYSRDGGLSITTDAGMTVEIGDSADLAFKLAVWRAILQRAREQKVQVREIDLRSGTHPYVR